MKRNVLIVAAALAVSTTLSASAQQQEGGQRGKFGRGQGFPGGFRRGQGFPGGGQGFPGGPGGMGMRGGMFGGGMSRVQDPAQSAAMTLLQRDDVRNELLITSRQREQLNALQTSVQEEFVQNMRQMFRPQGGGRGGRGGRGGQQGGGNSDANGQTGDAQANQTPEQRRQQMQAAMQEFSAGVDQKVGAILTPKQVARLHELDLQWRGPLALGDPRTAEELELTDEQRAAVTEQLNGYRDEQRKAMQEMMQGMFQNRTPGQAPQPPSEQQQRDMQTRMAEVRTKADKSLKSWGDKVLALLTPAQQRQWKIAQGRAFTFRQIP